MAELARTIGRRDLALLVIGSVIGSGIFLVPGGVLGKSGGSVGVAMLVWLMGGVLSLLGALTYSELGAMNPGSGGLYLYVRDAFGRLTAFLYGWTVFFVIQAGTVATLAVASSAYLEQFVVLGPTGRKAVSLTLIALLTWLNVRGTRISVTALNAATILKVAALVFLIVTLPLAGAGLGQVEVWWPEDFSPALLQGAGLAMVSVLWAYEGWQYATFVAGEVVEPQRNLPAGLAFGTLALVAIYVFANLAYVSALGPAGVAGSNRVAAEAMQATLGPGAAALIAIPIIISMASAAHGVMLTMPRVYFAMARDGVFFRRLGEIHPTYGTPAAAVVGGGAVAAVPAMLGTFEQLLNYVVFVGWIFYALGAASIFVFRRTMPDAPRPFRVPGYPWTPLLFILSAAAIVLNTIVSQPLRQTVVGLGVVALGLPAYWFWRRRAGT
ncbi:MAG TPA: amino acid permease [Gemmatimonadales bacterium]